MPNWKTLSTEIVYETKWMKVRRDEVIDHKGEKLTYSFAEIPFPAVIIVPMNEKGEIYLQNQYRYTINRRLWEVPAGGSDGEELEVAAKRELEEETGLVSDNWIDLGEFFPSDGMAKCPCQVYLARNVRKKTDRDGVEDISEARFFTSAEITEMIRANRLIDCESIAAISMAMLHLTLGEENNG